MIVSHTYKFIFFSNPKTGSESVRAMLAPFQEVEVVPFVRQGSERVFYPHMRPVEARSIFEERGWTFEEYVKLVFVRNPWARLVSLYEMIGSHEGWLGRMKRAADRIRASTWRGTGSAGFGEWLRDLEYGQYEEPDRSCPPWMLYGKYRFSDFVTDGSGRELVDEVIRLEDADRALNPLLLEVGLPLDAGSTLPRVNRRRHADYRTYYSVESRDLVGRLYCAEIERFGYKFSQ